MSVRVILYLGVIGEYLPHHLVSLQQVLLCTNDTLTPSFMGISSSLPLTAAIKMIDIWMIFTMMYPFIGVMLQSYIQVTLLLGSLQLQLFSFLVLEEVR